MSYIADPPPIDRWRQSRVRTIDIQPVGLRAQVAKTCLGRLVPGAGLIVEVKGYQATLMPPISPRGGRAVHAVARVQVVDVPAYELAAECKLTDQLTETMLSIREHAPAVSAAGLSDRVYVMVDLDGAPAYVLPELFDRLWVEAYANTVAKGLGT